MIRMVFITMLGLSGLGLFAQQTYFAADLRDDDQLSSYLGVVNPDREPLTVVFTGFNAKGEAVGTREVVLQRWSRFESAASELFPGEALSWAKVEAERHVAGFVRYEHADGNRFSMVPLNPIAGDNAFVSQPNGFEGVNGSEIALVNVAEESGTASIRPFLKGKLDTEASQPEEAVAIEGFGGAGQKTLFGYDTFFDKNEVDVIWDTVQGDGKVSLAGVQHFGQLAGTEGQMASVTLPRTSYREMVIAPFLPNQANFTNRFVLVNTYPVSKLPVQVIAYYDTDGPLGPGGPREFLFALEPNEKRVFTIDDINHLDLPANASWYKIIPHEGGLVGFQMTSEVQGQGLAASEGLVKPSSSLILPYVSNQGRFKTQVGLINPSDRDVLANVIGFDDQGRIRSAKTGIHVRYEEKKVLNLDTLFGAKASEVTAVRVYVNTGSILAFGVVSDRSGKGLAAMEAIPIQAAGSTAFFANFEHSVIETLNGQDWGEVKFDPDQRFHVIRKAANKGQYHDRFNFPAPGCFYMESTFAAKNGVFYFGYEPKYTGSAYQMEEPPPDRVAYMSPFFEVPKYKEFFLSYHMRFIEPLKATKKSDYGLVIREEGSTEWLYFGIKGETLLNSGNAIVNDCWVTVLYRNKDVTMTGWMPFEMKIPENFRGKRIQVGLYYNHVPAKSDARGPLYYIDSVRVSGDRLPYSLFFDNGSGTFEFDPASVEQDGSGMTH